MLTKEDLRSMRPLLAVANLICPPECLRCQISLDRESPFCENCIAKLVSHYSRCQRCATPIPSVVPNHDCHRCRNEGWRFDKVITLGPYRNDLKDVVVLMKKPHQEALRRAVASLMAGLAQSADAMVLPVRENATKDVAGTVQELDQTQLPLLVPVPNHWTHAFRGVADVAGTLTRQVGKETGWPVKTNIVRRIRKTAKQGMLSWSERPKNMRGAFQIRNAKELTGRHVILVDDVLTSGATAAEIASRLKRSGASRVSVLVAARGTGARETNANPSGDRQNVRNEIDTKTV